MEDSQKLRTAWNDVYTKTVKKYDASFSDEGLFSKHGVASTSSQNENSSKKPHSPSCLLDSLVSCGLRPKDPILNLLLDAISLKFVELEKQTESPQLNTSQILPLPVDENNSSFQTAAEDEDDETEDEDPFFSSPSLMNYNLKSLNHSRAKTPSPFSKNQLKAAHPSTSEIQSVEETSLQREKPVRRQLNYIESQDIKAATPELIELNEKDRGFLEDSTIVLDATPPPLPRPSVKSHHSHRETKNSSSNSTLNESLDATMFPPVKLSFMLPKKKKEAWVDADISRQKSKLSNPKRMRQVNLLTMARNFPTKKVDVTTLKEYNGGSLSCTESEPNEVGNENLNKGTGSKRKSDEAIEGKGKDKKDRLDSSSLSDTMFEMSPIKVITAQSQKSFKTPPSSPKPSTSAAANKKNKPLSPVQVNLIQNNQPKGSGFRNGKEKLESTLDLIKDFDKIPKRGPASPTFRYKEPTVRKKNERALLAGHECQECEQYYACLQSQLDEREIARVINRCSRHRAKAPPVNLNNTPVDFWSTKVPPTQELYDQRYIKVSSICFTPPKPRPPRESDYDSEDEMF
ncbi:unnamed protein product [Orchesella dallaii]|uniref:DNA endonuclease activator Ctp1 C-terminal domain-containing protein n=1 Tax=Orchesella dallaii TaxID=48710 RepID=A0ABP1PWW8_9HEXA